jgi:hypothetical protein
MSLIKYKYFSFGVHTPECQQYKLDHGINSDEEYSFPLHSLKYVRQIIDESKLTRPSLTPQERMNYAVNMWEHQKEVMLYMAQRQIEEEERFKKLPIEEQKTDVFEYY